MAEKKFHSSNVVILTLKQYVKYEQYVSHEKRSLAPQTSEKA